MAFKIFNYPFRHTVTEGEFNTAFFYIMKQAQLSKAAMIFDGLAVSATGLNLAITAGQAKCANVALSFLDSNFVLDNWAPFVELDSLTGYAFPANTTKYLVAQCVIDSTAAFQNSYTTTTDIKFVDSLLTTFPTGSTIGEIVLAKLVSDSSSITIDLTERAADIAGLAANVSSLISQFSQLDAKKIEVVGEYDPVANTPNLTTATAVDMQKKLYYVKSYSATANIGGVVQEVFENDIIVSNGSVIKVINSGRIWSD